MKLSVNDYIKHEIFGPGKIIGIKESFENRKLIIDFQKTGKKVLLESLAVDRIIFDDGLLPAVNPVISKNRELSIARWMKSYNALKKLYNSNSNPNFYDKKTGKRIPVYFWLHSQKRLLRNGELSRHRYDLLKEIVPLSELKSVKRRNSYNKYKQLDVLESILEHVVSGKPGYKHPKFTLYYRLLKNLEKQDNNTVRLIKKIKSHIKSIDSSGMGGNKHVVWLDRYDKFIDYIKTKKKFPKQYTNGNYKVGGKRNSMYRWYYKQMSRLKNNKLTDVQKDKFANLIELAKKYQIRGSKGSFSEKFQLFIKKYGNGKRPISRNVDGTRNKDKIFLDNNLQFYRSGKMSEDRYKLFKNEGYDFENWERQIRTSNKDALPILEDILEHVKDGKSLSSHPEKYFVYRRSHKRSLSKQPDEFQNILVEIKRLNESNKKSKLDEIFSSILDHVHNNEPIAYHPNYEYFYRRSRSYSKQTEKIKSYIDKINKATKDQHEGKTIKILNDILDFSKSGELIYNHSSSSVFFNRLKNYKHQTDEIKKIIDSINIYREANKKRKSPETVLNEILLFVKSGNKLKEHPKSDYYYNRIDELEYLSEEIKQLIKEIKYYMELNEFDFSE